MKIPEKILARQHEITIEYINLIDRHLQDVLSGSATEMFEIRDIAREMHIHPTHLSNTIKLVTGKHPCYFYEEKILEIVKRQLEDNTLSINDIAVGLTYDPSNFTKFFKRFVGVTPKQYREQYLMSQTTKTELLTI